MAESLRGGAASAGGKKLCKTLACITCKKKLRVPHDAGKKEENPGVCKFCALCCISKEDHHLADSLALDEHKVIQTEHWRLFCASEPPGFILHTSLLLMQRCSYKAKYGVQKACFLSLLCCCCFVLGPIALDPLSVECSPNLDDVHRGNSLLKRPNRASPTLSSTTKSSSYSSSDAVSVRQRARLDSYSSFECTASGSQAFDFDVQSVDQCRGYHDATDVHVRVCKLRDVCIVDGLLTYYVDPFVESRAPRTTRMEAFPGGGPACAGYLPLDCTCVPERTDIRHEPRPETLEFMSEDKVHLLDRMSDPSNYAHLLLDTVISSYAAADMFGDSLLKLQPVFLNNCTTFTDQEVHAHMRKGGIHYIVPGTNGKTAKDLCEEKTREWLPLAFDHPPMFPPHKDVCFRELVVGHSHALSVGSMFPHRGVSIRKLRQRVLQKLALPVLQPSREKHHVVVLEKVQLITPSLGLDVCDLTKRALNPATKNANLEPGDREIVKVTCITPAKMSIRKQMRAISAATVVVSEHGSTTYLSFFQSPGTSLVVIGAKEAMALLSNTDVQTWFHPLHLAVLPSGGGFAGLLHLALDRAGRRLGLPSLPP